jgi:hypothetical protein
MSFCIITLPFLFVVF